MCQEIRQQIDAILAEASVDRHALSSQICRYMTDNPKATMQDIYKELGVTPQRQKQLVSEGYIPKPHTLNKSDHFYKGRARGGWRSGMDGIEK